MAAINSAQANLQLRLWQAEADSISSSDLYIWLRDSGLPPEVALRLKSLIEMTATVGNKLLDLGKILLIKIIDFIKRNPNLAIGIALGAALSLAISAIPLLGPILAPIALPLGVLIGAVSGNRLDREQVNPAYRPTGLLVIPQEVIEIARKCLGFLFDTLSAVAEEIRPTPTSA